MNENPSPLKPAVTAARRVLRVEAEAIAALADRVDEAFDQLVSHIVSTTGRVIITGMGKSGIIAHKVAATLMSTGTPSFFLHPGEAYHGDLGMLTPGDTLVAISNSGETDEIVKLLPFVKSNGNALAAFTGNAGSTLARAARWHIDVAVSEEACSLQLAPTSSTTAALAMGDALAVATMEARGFRPEDFARFHPGGSLGRRLLARVEDEMVSDNLPIVDANEVFADLISAVTASRLGLALVRVDGEWAIVTDGDLRRGVDSYGPDVFALRALDLASRDPASVSIGTRMEDALAKMERLSVTSLLVFDGGALVGVLKK